MIADITSGLSSWWAPALAFAAGAVSCASPCVWPLVPGYVSFISGGVGDEHRRPVAAMLLFILGFTIVFVLLGAFATTFVRVFRSDVARWITGLVVVGLGLVMIGYAFQARAMGLYAEPRPLLRRVRPGTV